MPQAESAVTALYGRDGERDILRGFLERANRGAGGAVVLEGDGGIGKTRLVEEATRIANTFGFEVFAAAAEELERTEPLRPVDRLLHPVSSDPGSGVGATGVEGLVDVLEGRALRRPVLLVLEDLHWADGSTLAFVRAAIRRADGLPLAVLVTTRPPHDAPEIGQLLERLVAERVPIIRLEALSEVAVTDLVRDAIGGEPGPRLLKEIERAGGSPFYVLELLFALRHEHMLEQEAGVADMSASLLPPSLRVTLLRRLSALPPGSVEILKTAAVLGSSFPIDDLAIASGRSAMDLMDLLAPALAAGFLRDRDDRLAFRHDLVRAALYEDVPLGIRRALHRHVADAFDAAGYPSTKVAAHVAVGAEPGDRKAVDRLFQAALDVGITANAASVDLLRRAADLCDSTDPKRQEIRSWLVIPLAFTWRGKEAEEIARDVLDGPLPVLENLQARHGLAHALVRQARFQEAADEWLPMLAMDEVTDRRKVALAGELAALELMRGDVAAADVFARHAMAAPERFPIGKCSGAMVSSFVALSEGRLADAVEHGLEAARWSDVLYEMKTGLPPARAATGLALFAVDRGAEALEHLHIGQRRAEDADISNVAHIEQALCSVRYDLGDLDNVVATGSRILEVEDEFVQGGLIVYALVARIHLHRGDVPTAAALLARADERRPDGIPVLGTDLHAWVKALVFEAEGRAAEGLAELVSAWDAASAARYYAGSWRLIAPDLVRLALAHSRQDLVPAVVAVADDGARRAGQLGSIAFTASRIRGVATGDVDALVAAAEGLRSTPRVVETAHALADAGLALTAASQDGGTPYLVEALDAFGRLGATRDADQLRRSMREHGIRVGVRGSRATRAVSGWDALTEAERRVIELVKDGLTNAAIGDRLFISRRTVQTHLRNVFDKLGATSRAEVAAEAARRTR